MALIRPAAPTSSRRSRGIGETWVLTVWGIAFVASIAIAYVLHEPNSDLLSEWLAARAARDGSSPYLSITELAALYGFDYTNDLVMPRTPGALLLFQPIGFVPATWLPWVGSVSVAGLLVATSS